MDSKKILASVEKPYLKKVPAFRPGDTVRVFVKVIEGESERVQPFEGTVFRKRGAGLSETFSVRKISFGVGIERTFFLHSPRIEKIEVVKSGKVRRARLYYLRKLSGKAARLTEKEEMTETEDSSLKTKTASLAPANSSEPVAAR